jgi:hypothetical membrane protein
MADPREVPPTLAAAGIAGPIIFTAGYLVQGWFRRGEYNATTEFISDLEAGPGGWVQQLNFILFGLLMIAFAFGMLRGLRPAVAGPALLAWNGVELIVGGVFPLREDAAGVTYDPLGVHTVNGAIFFLSIGIGLVVLSRQLAGDPRWRGASGFVLGTGIALLAMFVALVALARPPDAVLHPWLGLVQRTVLAIWSVCIVVLALRLLGTTRTTRHAPAHR